MKLYLFDYKRKVVVGLGRFELPTHGLGNRCSILLSYRPTPQPFDILHLNPTIGNRSVSTIHGWLSRLFQCGRRFLQPADEIHDEKLPRAMASPSPD